MVIENLPAADAQGRAGIGGDTDFHAWALAKGVALATLLGTELAFDDESPLERALRQSAQGGSTSACRGRLRLVPEAAEGSGAGFRCRHWPSAGEAGGGDMQPPPGGDQPARRARMH